MKEINWKLLAEEHNLNPEEFTEQVLRCALVLMQMEIEKNKADKMTFKASGYVLTCAEFNERRR